MSNAVDNKSKVFDKILVSMIKSCVKNIKYDDAEKVINAYIGNYY
jgi:pentatricopeptide repeat protein